MSVLYELKQFVNRPAGALRAWLRLTAYASFFTLSAYFAAVIPPAVFWPAGFAVFAIPFFQILNLSFIIFWLFWKPRYALIPTITLLLGLRFIWASVAFHPFAKPKGIKVISYNVAVLHGGHKHNSQELYLGNNTINWLTKANADIICLQEFYNKPSSEVFNSVARLKKAGLKYCYFSKSWTVANQGDVGMAIFSRYPITASATLSRGSRGNNQILHSDIKTPNGIIRVYNVHLESLRIKDRELSDNDTRDEISRNLRSITRKIKRGYLARVSQLEILEQNLGECPYPIILCGDLNEVPYGNTYFRLRNRMDNAFEEAGKGFGFSLNGKVPFVRIDNQFATDGLEINSFSTRTDVPWSDHFPIEATYSIKKQH